MVLYKESYEIRIYDWDGNLFPAPALVGELNLWTSVSDKTGKNHNIQIVPVSGGKALIQNDSELIMVNFSGDIATHGSYNVSLNGTGSGKVSYFDVHALNNRIYFVDNSQASNYLYS